jgi:hypothetical protein
MCVASSTSSLAKDHKKTPFFFDFVKQFSNRGYFDGKLADTLRVPTGKTPLLADV